MMMDGLEVAADAAEYLIRCHRRPEPAVAQGRILADCGVGAAMDVSDGLSDDLSKLCQASGLAARIHAGRVPVHPLLKQAFPDKFLDLALNGGEDYVLLFTAAPELMRKVLPMLTGGATVIGDMLAGEPGQVRVVDSAGVEEVAQRSGWDHFG